jgi:hypothetical protein
MTDESLSLKLCEHSQRFLNRSLRWFCKSTHPKIDDIQNIEAEVLQVVVSAVN